MTFYIQPGKLLSGFCFEKPLAIAIKTLRNNPPWILCLNERFKFIVSIQKASVNTFN